MEKEIIQYKNKWNIVVRFFKDGMENGIKYS